MSPSVLLIVGQFNELISKSLHEGALQTLTAAGITNTKTVWVPGAFEMPVTASCAAATGAFDAIICLGAVIKGETPHFDFVAGQCAAGLMKVAVDTKVPTIFGVLTTNTVEEAMNRSGLKLGNKGREAATTAIDMLRVFSDLRTTPAGGSR